MAWFGLGRQKPHHYREMARVLWENRDALPFAWRILTKGVCDGCALGTTGLRDWTVPGVHLCMVRLELMRLNTAPAIDLARLADVDALASLSSSDLRALGRLSSPMLRAPGDRGFRTIAWDEAYTRIAAAIRATDPARVALYLTSRGITNEAYYAAAKAARFFGTNHVDNSARLCHAGSTSAMKATLGHGASTCSYADWLDADLIVLFGSNVANNQPVTAKYLHYAKQRGARVVVVNPYREPGLERYWIPSIAESAIAGTPIADDWFDVHTRGDLAFLIGVLRALCERGDIDEPFVREHTTGFDEAARAAVASDWDAIVRDSGQSRERIETFARLLADRPNAVFVWSMGLAQHAHGVETIRALVNVGLARGLPGRPRRGLMPIRGHSGVQGGAEVGCSPSVDAATARHLSDEWGFECPTDPGWTAAEMVTSSAERNVDVFWMVGGNFLETLPDADRSRAALARPKLRIHQDIVLSSSMLVESDADVLLLPATTRYESPGGGTETSTERRVIFSPEIPGRRIGSARPEWAVFRDVMRRVRPDLAQYVGLDDAAAIRREIARAFPLYAGIESLSRQGDQFQWGGPTLYADGRFDTPDGRARFTSMSLRATRPAAGHLTLSTRRGKQFNSMVQRDVDPLTGAARNDILISDEDLRSVQLEDGAAVTLHSGSGTFQGRLRRSAMKPGNLEVHWPEANALLSGEVLDPDSMEPDYNADVTIGPR